MSSLALIKNFHALSPNIGTSGMPTRSQLAEIADAGYEILINLALPGYPDAVPDEAVVATGRGLTYVHIPVAFDNPKVSDFELFAAIMRANCDRRVFVHCVMNYRVSAFMYLYRLIDGLATAPVALADLHKLWRPEAAWQDLIEEVLDIHGVSVTQR